MIVCNKCGCSNEDDARSCASCGHKLQSLRGSVPEDGREGGPVLFAEEVGYRDLLGPGGYFRKHLEAWICLVVLGGAAVACLWYGILWPLAAAIPVVGALAWWRKL